MYLTINIPGWFVLTIATMASIDIVLGFWGLYLKWRIRKLEREAKDE